jgi:hypothetical protein
MYNLSAQSITWSISLYKIESRIHHIVQPETSLILITIILIKFINSIDNSINQSHIIVNNQSFSDLPHDLQKHIDNLINIHIYSNSSILRIALFLGICVGFWLILCDELFRFYCLDAEVIVAVNCKHVQN